MQLAICTSGRLYCAMSQANTDSSSFCLFVSWLAKKLNMEERGSVERSLLLIDGARYQTCPESIRHMKALGFRVCVSAPYSYSSAPIELAFAFLKNQDLNPNSIPCGKKVSIRQHIDFFSRLGTCSSSFARSY